jgi:hypothetical protein
LFRPEVSPRFAEEDDEDAVRRLYQGVGGGRDAEFDCGGRANGCPDCNPPDCNHTGGRDAKRHRYIGGGARGLDGIVNDLPQHAGVEPLHSRNIQNEFRRGRRIYRCGHSRRSSWRRRVQPFRSRARRRIFWRSGGGAFERRCFMGAVPTSRGAGRATIFGRNRSFVHAVTFTRVRERRC